MMHVESQATLVDLACDRAGRTFDEQRRCPAPDHRNALKVGPKRYWYLDSDAAPGRLLSMR